MIARIACASLIATAIPASADPTSTRDQAERAVNEGRFADARSLYAEILAAMPNDAAALRAAGRVAHALGDFKAAADLLGRANLQIHRADPELHYLLGEALWELGRSREARGIHAQARHELGGLLDQRIHKLWLAKIDARLGDSAAADRIYDALVAADPTDVEASLAQVEMHAGARDWNRAEQLVRRFLSAVPDHGRGEELLAWVEEGQGDTASELTIRKRLATSSARVDTLRDYGRALERAGDWAGALDAYRTASRLPGAATDVSLTRAYQRLDQRMSPELAEGMTARSDPGTTSLGALTGVAIPFCTAHHVALGAWHERASGAGRTGQGSELSVAVALQGRAMHAIAGGKVGFIKATDPSAPEAGEQSHLRPAVFASVGAAALAGHLQLTVDGELGSLWNETPRAVLEGGRVDSVTAHVFGAFFGNRLVTDTGAYVRRLQLAETMPGSATSQHVLAWAGADLALWTNFSKQASGESLDDKLLQPTYLADSAVLSYRHYEMWGETNPMFAARLSFADRASIDEVSVVARKALARGRLAFEARVGGGRDWVRELYLSHTGVSIWIAASTRSRLTLSFDLAKESTTALTGERRSGWMAYHVDL
ncbi:hypothetical protein BH11MYX3_BH11MYX3_20250 [soil metagenome]